MAKLFSIISTVSRLIILPLLLLSPVRGLTIEPRQVISVGKDISDAISLGNIAGELSDNAIIGIVIGVITFFLLLIGGYCGRQAKKEKAVKKMEAQQSL
ncbi:hypothetical protein PM082_007204 [Marasmius tenuissimus]|nr:hypothetical protein PM082_007204 [Marasmius tenuissimus]